MSVSLAPHHESGAPTVRSDAALAMTAIGVALAAGAVWVNCLDASRRGLVFGAAAAVMSAYYHHRVAIAQKQVPCRSASPLPALPNPAVDSDVRPQHNVSPQQIMHSLARDQVHVPARLPPPAAFAEPAPQQAGRRRPESTIAQCMAAGTSSPRRR
jgi:hypothetical protein